ncbi:hypothetical protein [Actinoplanes utahensis]|uniref:Uncharacterized protein n=1 Tax=Actinoplanes utahensis TaxID=1869 RepID=A0A0A6U9N6_ACTUT|nr:hypothetical protein [Actinoplanes utahensis]KHD72755.1 hypothetical protein MB27_40890 [Actinoplanes utahensis]GIF29060.1 hypothetical protein Aut01nite_20460 [Actinoplanes utahensis]
MRNRARYLLMGTTTMLVAFGGMLAVYADWSVPGVSAVTAQAAGMPRGSTPRILEKPGEVVVRWRRQEITPGSPMDHYLVIAHHAGGPAKPDISRTVVAGGAATESVSFTTGELAGGRWYWTVTPKLHGWSGDASPKSEELTLPAAPAARPASPSGTATAGGGAVEPGPATTATAPAGPGASPAGSGKGPAGSPGAGTGSGGHGKRPEPKVTTTGPGAPERVPAPAPIESESTAVEPPPAVG